MSTKIPKDFSAWLSKNGQKGGRKATKAKSEAARVNIAKARAALAKLRKARAKAKA